MGLDHLICLAAGAAFGYLCPKTALFIWRRMKAIGERVKDNVPF